MEQNPNNSGDGGDRSGANTSKHTSGTRLRTAIKRHPIVGIAAVCCVLLAGAAVWIYYWNFGLPSTKQQAVRGIVAKLSKEDRLLLAQTRRDGLAEFHMGWGMGIRNGLGLWGKNRRLMRDISGGEPMHPDNMSGVIMEAVWDELHKGEQIPKFDESNPPAYFRQIDAWLRDAMAKGETKLLVHLPVWVLKDRSPYAADYLTHASVPLVGEARRLIAHKDSLAYLALQYLSEVERTGRVFDELEAFLDDISVIPLPQRVVSSESDAAAVPAYTWAPMTVSQLAVAALGDLRLFGFRSAKDYRTWKAKVEADPILRWRYRPVITDEDLRGLLENRIEFARILCRSQRWIEFDDGHHEPPLTREGAALLARLTGEKVSFDYQQRTPPALRLLQCVLAEVPLPELLHAMQLSAASIPADWGKVLRYRDQLDDGFFAAAALQSREAAIAAHLDKNLVWDLLELQRREAKVCGSYDEYLCRLLFRVDFGRTDNLARDMLLAAPPPKDVDDLFDRCHMLEAMLKDHFTEYRQLIKDLYFVGWPQKVNGARDYTGTINPYIMREDSGERQRLWEEIQRDPRYQEVRKRNGW